MSPDHALAQLFRSDLVYFVGRTELREAAAGAPIAIVVGVDLRVVAACHELRPGRR